MKFKDFLKSRNITDEAFKAMEVAEQAKLHSEYQDEIVKSIEAKASTEDVKAQIEEAKKATQKELETFLGNEIANQLADKTTKGAEINEPILKALKDNDEAIKEFLSNKKGTLELAVEKASQVPGDIADRDSYALMLPGTGRKPFRRFSILDLFRRTPVNKEFVKYREENVVTRDAKVVVACASSTHNTKKTWIERVVQITKIRDFVDVCVDVFFADSTLASGVF